MSEPDDARPIEGENWSNDTRLRQRIAELTAEVERLKTENATLLTAADPSGLLIEQIRRLKHEAELGRVKHEQAMGKIGGLTKELARARGGANT